MWHALYAALVNFSRLVWKRKVPSAAISTSRNLGSNPLLTIICLLAEDRDRSMMIDLGQRNEWGIFLTATREETQWFLQELKPQIILVDRDVAGQDWREFVTGFAAASPRACIMLISPVTDDYLWNEVVSNGGYEVLRKPLREDEVSRAVRMAWSYWTSAAMRALSSKRLLKNS